MCVTTSALHIALEQMMVHGVENDLWDLCASGIVKENELGSPIQGRKGGANGRNWKARGL
jgi:hypothetical protein